MPNLAHSRKQDPRRGKKRESAIVGLLKTADWRAILAPRQLVVIERGPHQVHRSRKMDFWGAFDILAIRAESGLLAIQSSTTTNFSHKRHQIESSIIWPLLVDRTLGVIGGSEDGFFLPQIWVWGYRIKDVGQDGRSISPGWHYRIYELRPAQPTGVGVEWTRVASCDSKGRTIEGWPVPDVLRPLDRLTAMAQFAEEPVPVKRHRKEPPLPVEVAI